MKNRHTFQRGYKQTEEHKRKISESKKGNKNPHWNYDTEQMSTTMDVYGNEQTSPVTVAGNNHFKNRKKPYVFLSLSRYP